MPESLSFSQQLVPEWTLLPADCDFPSIDSERQRDKLLETAAALRDAEKAVSSGYDIIALYLQSALSSLGELTGAVTGEDVLERLFSSFCLGK